MTAPRRILNLLALAILTAGCSAPHNASLSSPSAEIASIENSLMSPVQIKGQPPHKMALAARMRYYHIPSVSIAFFDPYGILWTRAYGANDETLFQAGSISKAVSAVGIMRIVQSKRLNLDENVNDLLHTWKLPENALTTNRPVTLRELLSHTAGTNVHGFEGYERGKPLPTLKEVLDGKPPANSPAIRVVSAPGIEYRYSGGGYTIVLQLLLDTIHEPFAKYMHEAVLSPLGMTNSTFQQPLPQNLWDRAAVAHDSNGKPYRGKWHVYPEQTAAGLWTTPADLAKFMIAMQRALDGHGVILSQATAREMLTPVKDHYGLGFTVNGTARGDVFGHDGSNAGFLADMKMHRGGQGIVIMTNSDNGSQLIGELENAVGSVYGWHDQRPKEKSIYAIRASDLRRFAGTYQIPQTPTLGIHLRAGALWVTQAGAPEDRLYPESPNTFFLLDQDLDVQFTSAKNGAVNGFAFKQIPGLTAKKVK